MANNYLAMSSFRSFRCPQQQNIGCISTRGNFNPFTIVFVDISEIKALILYLNLSLHPPIRHELQFDRIWVLDNSWFHTILDLNSEISRTNSGALYMEVGISINFIISILYAVYVVQNPVPQSQTVNLWKGAAHPSHVYHCQHVAHPW